MESEFLGPSLMTKNSGLIRSIDHELHKPEPIMNITKLLLPPVSARPIPQNRVPISRLSAHVSQEALVADQKVLLGDERYPLKLACVRKSASNSK